MRITGLKVEGGFLDGLKLNFRPGLNVLIGPRGAGKTSVIELIRFGLGIEANSEQFETDPREHALAVLREGEVTVEVESNGSQFIISRTAEDDLPEV